MTQTQPAIRLDMRMRNIQTLRLVQALMESSYHLHLTGRDRGQLAHLATHFNLRYSTEPGAAPLLPGIQVDHVAPATRVGSIERPLIFPRAMLEHCRGLWADARPVKFMFAGRITSDRRRALRQWVGRAGLRVRVPWPSNSFLGWVDRTLLRRGSGIAADGAPMDVLFFSSLRGRQYPTKAWDEEYHRTLARSQFVLCPSGDYVWTYRFFEAVMCGAIPVIEEKCPAYDGFQFLTMEQATAEARWDRDAAEQNVRLCRERLTVSREELDKEIERLLQGRQSG